MSKRRHSPDSKEDAVNRTAEFHEALINTMPFGFDVVDENGRILFMSPTMKADLGEEVLHRTCWSVYRDDRTQCTGCPLRDGIELGKTLKTYSKDLLGGRIMEISHTGIMFDGQKALLEVFIDITEAEHARERAAVEKERYRGLFEDSRDALVTLDLQTQRFGSCNQSAMSMFRASDEKEFVSMMPADLSPKLQPDGRRSVEKAGEMIQVAVREGSNYFEWTHKRFDGEEFLADVLITRTEHGGVTGIMATLRDITERTQARQKLESTIEQLEQALSEIKTLKGIIPICSYCKVIRNDEGAWEQLEAYVSEHTDSRFSHGICPDCDKKINASEYE